MNNTRRKEIQSLIERLAPIQDLFNELKEEADNLLSEEQDYFDNMPESLQYGDRGSMAQEAIDNLEQTVGAFEDIDIDGIIGYLSDAAS